MTVEKAATISVDGIELTVVWAPNNGPQYDFLACPAFEVLTGGARGGGKTEGLIMDALGQVHESEYRAIFFRLSYPDLQQLIERTQKYYPKLYPGVKWNSTEKCWTFPSGAKILFRYLKNADDWIHYQGHEYHWMGFEELTHFSESMYTNLIPSCRTTNPNIKCYIRATCNPGGIGHNWVKQRFVDPAPNGGEIFEDVVTGLTRAFFPSTYRNNPQLLAADPQYVKRLMMLSEADRKAMMDGDWDAYIGSVFKLRAGIHNWSWEYFNRMYGLPLNNRRIPSHWAKRRVMDWGYAKPFAIIWFAINPEGQVFAYREYYGVKKNAHGEILADHGVELDPDVVADHIREIEVAAGEWDVESNRSLVSGVADPACWAQGRGDYGGGPSVVERMRKKGVHWTHAKNDRIQGKMMVHTYLAYEENKAGELVQRPELIILGESCPNGIRTLPALEYDPNIVEDIDTTMEDHWYDALRYFCMSRPIAPKVSKETILSRLRNTDDTPDAWSN